MVVFIANRYGGPYLLDAIDSLQPPTREFSKPLLMPVCDVIKSTTLGQVSASGKLEAGALRSGSKVYHWAMWLLMKNQMIDMNLEFFKLEVLFTDLKLTEFLLGINNILLNILFRVFTICTWCRN